MTTKPLSLEIVSPLVAPAAAVCVIEEAVFEIEMSPKVVTSPFSVALAMVVAPAESAPDTVALANVAAPDDSDPVTLALASVDAPAFSVPLITVFPVAPATVSTVADPSDFFTVTSPFMTVAPVMVVAPVMPVAPVMVVAPAESAPDTVALESVVAPEANVPVTFALARVATPAEESVPPTVQSPVASSTVNRTVPSDFFTSRSVPRSTAAFAREGARASARTHTSANTTSDRGTARADTERARAGGSARRVIARRKRRASTPSNVSTCVRATLVESKSRLVVREIAPSSRSRRRGDVFARDVLGFLSRGTSPSRRGRGGERRRAESADYV